MNVLISLNKIQKHLTDPKLLNGSVQVQKILESIVQIKSEASVCHYPLCSLPVVFVGQTEGEPGFPGM